MQSPYTQKLSVCSPPSNSPLGDEIPGGVIGQVPIAISGTSNPTVTNLEALLYCRKDNCHCLQPTNGTDISNQISTIFRMEYWKNKLAKGTASTTYHLQLESTMGFQVTTNIVEFPI